MEADEESNRNQWTEEATALRKMCVAYRRLLFAAGTKHVLFEPE